MLKICCEWLITLFGLKLRSLHDGLSTWPRDWQSIERFGWNFISQTMIDLYKLSIELGVFSTILPYLTYAWVFKLPNSFRKFFTQKQLIHFAQFMKLFEVAISAPTLYKAGINNSGVAIGLFIIFVGQYLNEIVYSVLGDAGVYYGLELKVVKPRKIGGFPFNIHDPQYKGSILTIIGGLYCFNTTKELMILIATWMLSYFGIVLVENTQPAIDQ